MNAPAITIGQAQRHYETTGKAVYVDADNAELVEVSRHGGYESHFGDVK